MESGIHVAEVEALHGLAVRPDVLVIALSARVDDVGPAHAVSIFKIVATTLQKKVLEVHPRAELMPRKLDLGRNQSEKASKATLADSQLDGVLHVPLDDSLDYWGRAALLAKITEALRSFSVEIYKAKPTVRFGFRPPVPRVRDVTAHKRELSDRYAAQWRLLTSNLEKARGAVSWELPDEVHQHAVSLEEVRLTLVPTRKYTSTRDS